MDDMFRFLAYAFGWRDFDPCKSCETLKQQLDLANAEKKELTATLLNLVRPQVVEQPTVQLEPFKQSGALWSRRKAILEEQDRLKARTIRESRFAATPDNKLSGDKAKEADESIAALEDELKIAESN